MKPLFTLSCLVGMKLEGQEVVDLVSKNRTGEMAIGNGNLT